MISRKFIFSVICFILIGSSADASTFSANVKDFGAKGNGVTNDTQAFKKALASGRKDVYIPAGKYLIGPETIAVPAQIILHGDGAASVLKLAKNTGVIFKLGKSVTINRVAFDGKDGKSGGVPDGVLSLPNKTKDIVIDSVSFLNCDRACIVTDHSDDLIIQNCTFRNIGLAISLVFSQRVKITGNSVFNARLHGIQFWGCYDWKSKDGADIIITGNYVKDGGGGAIWGSGTTRAVIANNIVDGAKDVGIDLEWCDDSVISGNTVRNFENAGISLFFACRRVSITGNTIINDRPIADPNAVFWIRAGIWLTDPNRKSYQDDHGHKDIAITGNVINCAGGNRRAMYIGAESENVTITGNTTQGGEITKR